MSEPEPAGCASCAPASAKEAHRARAALTERAVLIDESHILTCPRCGQAFLTVFTETIDWVDSEDPQHWALVSLRSDECDELLGRGAAVEEADLERLGAGRRILEIDHPKSGGLHPSWGMGPLRIRLHE